MDKGDQSSFGETVWRQLRNAFYLNGMPVGTGVLRLESESSATFSLKDRHRDSRRHGRDIRPQRRATNADSSLTSLPLSELQVQASGRSPRMLLWATAAMIWTLRARPLRTRPGQPSLHLVSTKESPP